MDRLRGLSSILQKVLVLIGVIFILISLMVLGTCTLSDPPQCGTILDAAPFFSVSILSFILAYSLGKREESEVTDGE
tara:strand:- start:1050 stop:1280 length:231 start_codon:yes stop_codon:yes gene_type:complete